MKEFSVKIKEFSRDPKLFCFSCAMSIVDSCEDPHLFRALSKKYL